MATKIYTYPRVNVNKTLVEKRNITPYKEDTTVLFVPIVADKGPTGEIVRIYSLTEFISVFGELNYEKQGQIALNIANWLSSGGTIYAYRVIENESATAKIVEEKDSNKVVEIEAKYAGEYYNDLRLEFVKHNTLEKYSLNVKIGENILVEKYGFDTLEKLKAAVNKNSEHIVIKALTEVSVEKDYTVTESVPAPTTTHDELLLTFWSTTAPEKLANKLETPIDTIMDAGYNINIKNAMAAFVSTATISRPDIVLILDTKLVEYDTTNKKYKESIVLADAIATFPSAADLSGEATNIAVYEQYFVIEENNTDLAVTPTYFLSKLLPYNDKTYGKQWATAGLRRGILNGVKSISENPTPDKKETWFTGRFNYAEKTSREVAFMSQRTYDGSSDDSFTALSFLNNARVTAQIVKDLERLGREYLFEFNDAITLSQMSSVLNKYLSEWIANRTLSVANVEVSASEYSENAVDITLYIKFTGTIEVITIDITIE